MSWLIGAGSAARVSRQRGSIGRRRGEAELLALGARGGLAALHHGPWSHAGIQDGRELLVEVFNSSEGFL